MSLIPAIKRIRPTNKTMTSEMKNKNKKHNTKTKWRAKRRGNEYSTKYLEWQKFNDATKINAE